ATSQARTRRNPTRREGLPAARPERLGPRAPTGSAAQEAQPGGGVRGLRAGRRATRRDPIPGARLRASNVNDLPDIPDHSLSWLEASGDHADIVLSTRVRLARNLQ